MYPSRNLPFINDWDEYILNDTLFPNKKDGKELCSKSRCFLAIDLSVRVMNVDEHTGNICWNVFELNDTKT